MNVCHAADAKGRAGNWVNVHGNSSVTMQLLRSWDLKSAFESTPLTVWRVFFVTFELLSAVDWFDCFLNAGKSGVSSFLDAWEGGVSFGFEAL